MDQKIGPARDVAVLAGGVSSEREVSLASGQQMAAALAAAGHRVSMIDPARSELAEIRRGRFDVCVLALHGASGEDGTIQRALQRWNVPFSGSRALASARAMSKATAKIRFRLHGIPTPQAFLLPPGVPVELYREPLSRLGFPVVVKPEGEGSSIGVGTANSMDSLSECVARSRQCGGCVLVERQIIGREFTVSLLGRRPLPLLEIVGTPAVFDYDAKYVSGQTRYDFDYDLPDSAKHDLIATAVRAAEALDTSGLARVDLMLDESDRPWVLEINTLPGMTDHSLAPMAAQRIGMPMPALCDWIVRDALERSRYDRALDLALSAKDRLPQPTGRRAKSEYTPAQSPSLKHDSISWATDKCIDDSTAAERFARASGRANLELCARFSGEGRASANSISGEAFGLRAGQRLRTTRHDPIAADSAQSLGLPRKSPGFGQRRENLSPNPYPPTGTEP